MTHIRRTSALVLLVFVSTIAFAAPPVHFWNDPVDACQHNHNLDRVLRNLDHDGFAMQSMTPNALRYLVEPTADYVWGTVTYTLTRSAGDLSLETDYSIVHAEVSYFDGLGFKVTRVTTEEFTVY